MIKIAPDINRLEEQVCPKNYAKHVDLHEHQHPHEMSRVWHDVVVKNVKRRGCTMLPQVAIISALLRGSALT